MIDPGCRCGPGPAPDCDCERAPAMERLMAEVCFMSELLRASDSARTRSEAITLPVGSEACVSREWMQRMPRPVER